MALPFGAGMNQRKSSKPPLSVIPPPLSCSPSLPFFFLRQCPSFFGSVASFSYCMLPFAVVQRRAQENYEIKQVRIVNLNLSPPLGFIGPVGSPLGLYGGGMTNSYMSSITFCLRKRRYLRQGGRSNLSKSGRCCNSSHDG